METRPVSRFFIKPCIGAVTICRAWQMYGPPTREVNSGAKQNDVLFGVCCPNRGANRSASVCLLPNRQFCSAVCWAASSSDACTAAGRRPLGRHATHGATRAGRRDRVPLRSRRGAWLAAGRSATRGGDTRASDCCRAAWRGPPPGGPPPPGEARASHCCCGGRRGPPPGGPPPAGGPPWPR